MNEHENRPETGRARGESDSPYISEDFITLPINSCGYSEEEINILLLQNIVPDARPLANDTIPWTETGTFVNDFQEMGLFCKTSPTLYPSGHGDPT